MHWLTSIDWGPSFLPDTSLLEIVLRGTIVYLVLFFLLRVILKRQSGEVGVTDLLVIVLIADAAQNAMADDYQSVSDGVLLVATIVFWSYTLDWLGYRFPWLNRLIYPPPILLVRNGRLLRANMKHELITEGELRSQLRLRGVKDVTQVKEAYMEADGRISVVTDEQVSKGAPEKPEA